MFFDDTSGDINECGAEKGSLNSSECPMEATDPKKEEVPEEPVAPEGETLPEETAPDTETVPEDETVLEETVPEDKTVLKETAPEDEAEKQCSEKKPAEKQRGILSFLSDTVELVAISLAVVMIVLSVIMRHSPVEGSSMLPTIEGKISTSEELKDVLLISGLFYTPKTGDIVVIQTPTLERTPVASMNRPIVKRVIATGGDTLTIDTLRWKVTVNGQVTEDGWGSVDYVKYEGELNGELPTRQMAAGELGTGDYRLFTDIEGCTVEKTGEGCYTLTIPEGYLFVMGDNRNNSKDSRSIGLIDERWVLGRVLIRIFPFDRIGTVD